MIARIDLHIIAILAILVPIAFASIAFAWALAGVAVLPQLIGLPEETEIKINTP